MTTFKTFPIGSSVCLSPDAKSKGHYAKMSPNRIGVVMRHGVGYINNDGVEVTLHFVKWGGNKTCTAMHPAFLISAGDTLSARKKTIEYLESQRELLRKLMEDFSHDTQIGLILERIGEQIQGILAEIGRLRLKEME